MISFLKRSRIFVIVLTTIFACSDKYSGTEGFAGIKLGEPLNENTLKETWSHSRSSLPWYTFSNGIVRRFEYFVLPTANEEVNYVTLKLGKLDFSSKIDPLEEIKNSMTKNQFNYFYNLLIKKYGKESSKYIIDNKPSEYVYNWDMEKIHVGLVYDTITYSCRISYYRTFAHHANLILG